MIVKGGNMKDDTIFAVIIFTVVTVMFVVAFVQFNLYLVR